MTKKSKNPNLIVFPRIVAAKDMIALRWFDRVQKYLIQTGYSTLMGDWVDVNRAAAYLLVSDAHQEFMKKGRS